MQKFKETESINQKSTGYRAEHNTTSKRKEYDRVAKPAKTQKAEYESDLCLLLQPSGSNKRLDVISGFNFNN